MVERGGTALELYDERPKEGDSALQSEEDLTANHFVLPEVLKDHDPLFNSTEIITRAINSCLTNLESVGDPDVEQDANFERQVTVSLLKVLQKELPALTGVFPARSADSSHGNKTVGTDQARRLRTASTSIAAWRLKQLKPGASCWDMMIHFGSLYDAGEKLHHSLQELTQDPSYDPYDPSSAKVLEIQATSADIVRHASGLPSHVDYLLSRSADSGRSSKTTIKGLVTVVAAMDGRGSISFHE